MSTKLSAGAFGAGMALNAFGIYNQINAENQANEYNAQVAENNAIANEYNANMNRQRADLAIQRGKDDVKKFRQRREQLRGTQRANYGASGVVVDSGSVLDVDMDIAEQTELDAITMNYNSEVEAYDYRVRAYNDDVRARDARFQASQYKARKRSPVLPVVGSLLNGVSQLDGRYFGNKKTTKSSEIGSAYSYKKPKAEIYKGMR